MGFVVEPKIQLHCFVCPDLMQQQQQHNQLVSQHRKFNYDSNGNAQFYPQHPSAKDYLNLPQINNTDQRMNDQANRLIAKQKQKMIKVFTAIDYPVF